MVGSDNEVESLFCSKDYNYAEKLACEFRDILIDDQESLSSVFLFQEMDS